MRKVYKMNPGLCLVTFKKKTNQNAMNMITKGCQMDGKGVLGGNHSNRMANGCEVRGGYCKSTKKDTTFFLAEV